MATVYDPTQEEEEQTTPGEQPVTSGPTTISSGVPGGAPAPTSGGGRTAPSPTDTAQKGSGRFTNLQKYLQANVGAADYAGRIGEGIEETRGKLQRGVEEARAGVEAAAQPEIQRLQGAQGTIQQALADPTQYTADPTRVQQFQQLRTGQTADVGRDISEQQRQAQRLGEQAALTGTEAGRYQLLRQTFGSPTYSRGQAGLDQLLLQGQTGQLRNLQQTAQQAAQAGQTGVEDLQQLMTGYQQQIGQLGTAAQEAAQTGVTGAQTGLQETLAQRAQETAAGRQAEYEATRQALLGGGLPTEIAQQAGLQPGQFAYGISGEELASYLSPYSTGPVTAQQVTTPEEAARLTALSQLAGQDQTFTAGEALPGAVQFDVGQLQSALGTKREGFKQDLAAIHTAMYPNMRPEVREQHLQTITDALETGTGAGVRKDFEKLLTNPFNDPYGTNPYLEQLRQMYGQYGVTGYDPTTKQLTRQVLG